jgi:uncharacterized protein (DUF2384 family)
MYIYGYGMNSMSYADIEDKGVVDGPEVPGIDRFSSENRGRLSGPGMRTFLNTANAWGLGERDRIIVLGHPARSTFHKWARDAKKRKPLKLPADVLTRISAVLGIHKALQILYLTPQEGVQWLRTPNRALLFDGQRPMDLITSGTQDGLLQVRRYLDAQRGGIFAAPTNAPFEEQIWQADEIVIAD